MSTKTKTKTPARTEATKAALVEAQASYATYGAALRQARKDLASLELQLGRGDDSITGADLVRTQGDIARLELLASSAKAAAASARKADDQAQADEYVGVLADILAEHLGGHVPVVHLAPGEKVPAVASRTLFVQMDRRRTAKVDLVSGTIPLYVVISSASLLDEDARALLPGWGKGKAYVAPVVGEAGEVSRFEYGQQYRHEVDGTTVYGVALKVTVAAARPLLQAAPPAHAFNALAQRVRGELRRPRNTAFNSGDTMALDAWETIEVKPTVKVGDDGVISSTFKATLPVAVGHPEDNGRAVESVQHRIGALEGRHVSGIGRIAGVEIGTPRFRGLMVNGNITSKVMAYVPVTITLAAKLAEVDEQDEDR